MELKYEDYDALKRRGFLRQKQEGYFLLRTRTSSGNYNIKQFTKITDIADRFGDGTLHATTRQGIEIPFIKYDDIDIVEKEITDVGINNGTSGPRMRSTTTCPGNNWCKSGLVNTFALYDRIEQELCIKCGMELPHKFKISISGCPNRCTRPEVTEIGLHGQADVKSPGKKRGYAVYLGGCGGRTPHFGIKLDKVFMEDEVLELIPKVVNFFKAHAKPRQRLALLIKEFGREKFLEAMGVSAAE